MQPRYNGAASSKSGGAPRHPRLAGFNHDGYSVPTESNYCADVSLSAYIYIEASSYSNQTCGARLQPPRRDPLPGASLARANKHKPALSFAHKYDLIRTASGSDLVVHGHLNLIWEMHSSWSPSENRTVLRLGIRGNISQRADLRLVLLLRIFKQRLVGKCFRSCDN